MESRQPYKKVVAWDFDGQINDIALIREKHQHDADKEVMDSSWNPMKGAVLITDAPLIQTVLKILEQNNILSVLASQRITYSRPDEIHLRNAILTSLDENFGNRRSFLTQEHAVAIGKPLQERADETGRNKSIILDEVKKITGCEEIPNQDIYLLDDQSGYKDNVEQGGYSFIHAPRADQKGSYEDRKHLAEVLARVVDKPYLNLLEDILKNAPDRETADALNAALVRYYREIYKDDPVDSIIDKVKDGISHYNILRGCSAGHLSLVSRAFDKETGLIRGQAYADLFGNARGFFQKKVIAYALLASKKGPTLQEYVLSQMRCTSLEQARAALRTSIEIDLEEIDLENKPDAIKKLINDVVKPIIKNANAKKTVKSGAYNNALDSLTPLTPAAAPSVKTEFK